MSQWFGFHRRPARDEGPGRVECQRCGKAGLKWDQYDDRWLLVDPNGAVHKCDPARTHKKALDDFEDIL